MKLKNYMETAIDHILPTFLKAFPDVCQCDVCLLDIKAIALNKLKPRYVVTDKGETWVKIDEMDVQQEADLLKALVDGIAIVKRSPRHK